MFGIIILYYSLLSLSLSSSFASLAQLLLDSKNFFVVVYARAKNV